MSYEPKYTEEYRRRGFSQGILVELSNARHAAEKLQKALEWLPSVDNEGNSKAPHATQLYREKERLAQEARAKLASAEFALDVIVKELNRCRKDVVKMRQTGDRLRHPKTRGAFREDIDRELKHLEKVLEQRRSFEQVIATLRALLRESDQRVLPDSDGTLKQTVGKSRKGSKRKDTVS